MMYLHGVICVEDRAELRGLLVEAAERRVLAARDELMDFVDALRSGEHDGDVPNASDGAMLDRCARDLVAALDAVAELRRSGW